MACQNFAYARQGAQTASSLPAENGRAEASAMRKPEGHIDPSRDRKISLKHDSQDAKEVA
jgi:hypothetical protein